MTIEACTCVQVERRLFWCTLAFELSRAKVMRRNTDNIFAVLITAVAHKR